MKLNVIGFEVSEGVSTKTGKPKPYSIGQLHTILPLSGRAQSNEPGSRQVSKGALGSTYRVEVGVLEKIMHLEPPFVVEAESADVMRFGERVSDIIALHPIERTASGSTMPVKRAA